MALRARPTELAVQERQLDVLHRRSPRQQIETLKDESDLRVADDRTRIAIERGNIDAIENVRARGRPIEAAEDVHERRFSGPGGAHDGDELSLVDIEIDAGERVNLDLAHCVDLRQISNLDDFAGHYLPPRPPPGPRGAIGFCDPGGPGPSTFDVARPITTLSPSFKSPATTSVK